MSIFMNFRDIYPFIVKLSDNQNQFIVNRRRAKVKLNIDPKNKDSAINSVLQKLK